LSVFDIGQQLTMSNAVAAQLVGHSHPWFIPQALQQPLEEALRRLRIATGLNEDIEHNTILIDGTPEIMLHTLNADEHFVDVPLVTGAWPAPSQAISETGSEIPAPPPHGIVRYNNVVLCQDQPDIPKAEAEHRPLRRLR
jgi:hypothetical protein